MTTATLEQELQAASQPLAPELQVKRKPGRPKKIRPEGDASAPVNERKKPGPKPRGQQAA